MRRAVAILLIVLAPLARADQTTDTADLIAIVRAIHPERCGFTTWLHEAEPLVLSDRPEPTRVDPKTRKTARMFDIDLVPRAPPGTLWPRVTICPGLGFVDHARLELFVPEAGGLPNDSGAFAIAFGGADTYETLTLPAFSPDGNRAVVYREYLCPLCGNGMWFELTRTKSGWEVTRQQLVWIS